MRSISRRTKRNVSSSVLARSLPLASPTRRARALRGIRRAVLSKNQYVNGSGREEIAHNRHDEHGRHPDTVHGHRRSASDPYVHSLSPQRYTPYPCRCCTEPSALRAYSARAVRCPDSNTLTTRHHCSLALSVSLYAHVLLTEGDLSADDLVLQTKASRADVVRVLAGNEGPLPCLLFTFAGFACCRGGSYCTANSVPVRDKGGHRMCSVASVTTVPVSTS